MTCRGYDSKSVKVSKTVKRMASTILNKDLRRAYIRSYAAIAQSELRTGRKDSK